MSVTVDSNVLVYASNKADPAHAPARAVVEQLAAGPRLVYVFWPVVLAYLRIVTHPAILPHPLASADAQANVDRLIARPHVRTPGELDGFWPVLRGAAGPNGRGNDLPHAHVVALMRQHGVAAIYTRDRDFLRYRDIIVHDPFS